ncbi:MAG: M13 family metallopeptidase [Lactobacillales bacterium]|jgi:putative endopeptidase|nr:M13 family metallopeptidase [Lactobacillales bacterium]
MSNLKNDFYEYVNHDWLEKTEIPADKPVIAAFSQIDEDVEKLLIEDLRQFAAGEKVYEDENFKKFIQYYQVALNVEERNRLGATPIKGLLDEVEALNDFADYAAKFLADQYRGLPGSFSFSIESDLKDSEHYAFYASAPGLILPDVTSYQEDNAADLLASYADTAAKLLVKAGYEKDAAETHAQNAIKFDELLVPVVKTAEEQQDYVGAYNPVDVETFDSSVDFIDLKDTFNELFDGKAPEHVIVTDPRFFDNVNDIYTAENFESFKSWILIRTIFRFSGLLDLETRDIAFEFTKKLTGQPELPTIEKSVFRQATGAFADIVGLYYGKTYFGEAAKKDVLEMIELVVAMYKERLLTSEWMTPETAAKAVEKLEGIKPYIGFPDKTNPIFDQFEAAGYDQNANYLTNYLYLTELEIAHRLSVFQDKVDRELWFMGAHQVNAYYSPVDNIICFPAAILQYPFYSYEESRAANLGGIGAVIAHEITHAFDSNGAKIDLHGNINNWWTDEDFANFEERVKQMEDLFEGVEVDFGLKVNGKLTVSENIADHGGLTCVTKIATRDGLDLHDLFENWARVWRNKPREEFLKVRVATDVHSPAKARGNRQLSNTDEFYEVYDIKEGDAMYLAPEDRVYIW